MKKLMMVAAVAACVTMNASAGSIYGDPDPNAASITAVWLTEDDILGIQSNPDVLDILGVEDSCYEVVFGEYDYGYFVDRKIVNFPIGSHISTYPFVEYPSVTIRSWAAAFEEWEDAKVFICHNGDHGTDSETTIRVQQLGRLYKTTGGVWKWVGENGTGGIVGTAEPVVEDEDEPEDDPVVEEKTSKCPVISFFQKIFKRR